MANEPSEIIEFIKSMPEHVILCFDEAYAEYLEELPNLVPYILQGKNIICLRTFSKIYDSVDFESVMDTAILI